MVRCSFNGKGNDAKARTAGQYMVHNLNGKMDRVLKSRLEMLWSNFNGKTEMMPNTDCMPKYSAQFQW